MHRALLAGAALALALLVAALAGVGRVAERRPTADAVGGSSVVAEPGLPTLPEVDDSEASASPRLTR
jgi:hypothetical protein